MRRKLKKALLLSALSIVVLLLSYFVQQWLPYAVGENSDVWQLIHRLDRKGEEALDDGLFINMAFDNEIVDYYPYKDEGGERTDLYKGNINITDRKALLDLLSRLNENGTYRYIILDIRFEEGMETPYDSALFSLIAETPRLVIPSHSGESLATGMLLPKAARADSRSPKSNIGFSKMQFVQEGEPSIPLKVYSDLTGRTIRNRLLYMDGWKPCTNTLFLHIPNVPVPTEGWERPYYKDYGPELADDARFFSSLEYVEDKVVVIGDFVEDCSGTYNGDQANPLLLYLATQSLMRGDHLYSGWFLLSMFLVYFFAASLAVSNGKQRFFVWLNRHKIILLIVSFLSYEVFFSLVAAVVFAFTQYSISIFIPSTLFSLIKQFTKLSTSCE